jgi:hypothetical protein
MIFHGRDYIAKPGANSPISIRIAAQTLSFGKITRLMLNAKMCQVSTNLMIEE